MISSKHCVAQCVNSTRRCAWLRVRPGCTGSGSSATLHHPGSTRSSFHVPTASWPAARRRLIPAGGLATTTGKPRHGYRKASMDDRQRAVGLIQDGLADRAEHGSLQGSSTSSSDDEQCGATGLRLEHARRIAADDGGVDRYIAVGGLPTLQRLVQGSASLHLRHCRGHGDRLEISGWLRCPGLHGDQRNAALASRPEREAHRAGARGGRVDAHDNAGRRAGWRRGRGSDDDHRTAGAAAHPGGHRPPQQAPLVTQPTAEDEHCRATGSVDQDRDD
jgi:hypothetical protein